MRRILAAAMAAVVLAAGAFAAYHFTRSAPKDCLVMASGNKLCGADAAAWCKLTDNNRMAGYFSLPPDEQRQRFNSIESCLAVEHSPAAGAIAKLIAPAGD